jgi:hypothetical protein
MSQLGLKSWQSQVLHRLGVGKTVKFILPDLQKIIKISASLLALLKIQIHNRASFLQLSNAILMVIAAKFWANANVKSSECLSIMQSACCSCGFLQTAVKHMACCHHFPFLLRNSLMLSESSHSAVVCRTVTSTLVCGLWLRILIFQIIS